MFITKLFSTFNSRCVGVVNDWKSLIGWSNKWIPCCHWHLTNERHISWVGDLIINVPFDQRVDECPNSHIWGTNNTQMISLIHVCTSTALSYGASTCLHKPHKGAFCTLSCILSLHNEHIPTYNKSYVSYLNLMRQIMEDSLIMFWWSTF